MGGKESKELENLPSTLTGLYQSCKWEPKSIKKFITTKKIAPIFLGKDSEENSEDLEECPICFLNYPFGLNRFTCCKKGVCTECFLQLSIPNTLSVNNCPFCNRTNSSIIFTGPKTKEEKAKEAEEKQKVIELQIKIRNDEIERDKQKKSSMSTSAPEASPAFPPPNFSTTPTFPSFSFPPSSIQTETSSGQSSPMQSRSLAQAVNPLPPRPLQSSNLKRRISEHTTKTNPTFSNPRREEMTSDEIEDLLIKQAIELSLSRDFEKPEKIEEEKMITTTATTESFKSAQEETTTRSSSVSSESSGEADLELAMALSLSLHK